MRVDIGNALAAEASPGIAREALERLDDRVGAAHDRIERGRADDDVGYAALDLPETVDPDRIRRAVAPLADRDPETVLVVGIGGSALGAATLGDALPTDADLRVLDNVDPAHTDRVLDGLDPATTAMVVVSRSGTTAETLANFLVARRAFDRAGTGWTDRTLAVTGPDGPLRDLVDRHDLPSLPVPAGVPGRFGVLSPVGLAPAALAGVDVEAVLAGARAVAGRASGSLFEYAPYAYGATAYALDARGATVNAAMPYVESLETFAEWFAQLWAESLGKDGLGQLPARALGATDQHSQLQLYRAGPRNVAVTFLRPRERPSLAVPDDAPSSDRHGDEDDSDHDAGGGPEDGGTDGKSGSDDGDDGDDQSDDPLGYLRGTDLAELIDAELRATEASLAVADRPSVRVEIDRVDAREVGGLLYGFEAACVLAGELYGIDAFDQPAVEWGKRATRDLVAGRDTPAARAVEDKRSLWVE